MAGAGFEVAFEVLGSLLFTNRNVRYQFPRRVLVLRRGFFAVFCEDGLPFEAQGPLPGRSGPQREEW